MSKKLEENDMNYKVIVDGNEIEYGALIEKSSFTKKEWAAIYAEVVKQNQPVLLEYFNILILMEIA
ncbi:TPA: hypothetical protein ACGO35_000816 [Streptococcus suis]